MKLETNFLKEGYAKELFDIKDDQSPFFIRANNKIDLSEQRKVKEEEGKLYANNHNYIFQEVSALTGEGIQELFLNKLLSQIRTQLLYKGKFIVSYNNKEIFI